MSYEPGEFIPWVPTPEDRRMQAERLAMKEKDMLMDKQTEVPLVVIDAMAGEDILEVKLRWAPGRDPSGLSGPPENYDPGDGPDIEIISATICGADAPLSLTEEQEEAIAEWIACNEPIEWFSDWYGDGMFGPDDCWNEKQG